MDDVVTEIRRACRVVAERARHARIAGEGIVGSGAGLPLAAGAAEPDREAHVLAGSREVLAAFWLTLDAINFGSGWFPTLRKRPGRSGYFTVAAGGGARFGAREPSTTAQLRP